MNIIFGLVFLISCFRFSSPPSLDPGEGFQWEIVMKNYVKNEYLTKGFGRRNKKTDVILWVRKVRKSCTCYSKHLPWFNLTLPHPVTWGVTLQLGNKHPDSLNGRTWIWTKEPRSINLGNCPTLWVAVGGSLDLVDEEFESPTASGT